MAEKTLYVVVDMQNDFITGSLANKEAEAIVEPMAKFLGEVIKDKHNIVVATRDSHGEGYLDTYEGKNLPIVHCLDASPGWQIHDDLINVLRDEKNEKKLHKNAFVMDKEYFNAGEKLWCEFLIAIDKYYKKVIDFDHIVFMGTCTDICVISNAFSLKAIYPEIDFVIISDLCAGLTVEKHNAALEVMRSCQMKVMSLEEYKEYKECKE